VKPWIETRKFWFNMDQTMDDEARGENWRLRRVTPDRDALDGWLTRLIEEFNQGQWEIKTVIPIDRGRVYQEIAPLPPVEPKKGRKQTEADLPQVDAYGLGWGTATTWAICIVAQRTIWLSDEDYAKRIAERSTAEASDEVKTIREESRKQNLAIEAEIANLLLERDKLAQARIAHQKSLFGKSGWQFGQTRYASESEAEAARAAAIADLDTRIAALRNKLLPILGN
jgi:hypothetical protein